MGTSSFEVSEENVELFINLMSADDETLGDFLVSTVCDISDKVKKEEAGKSREAITTALASQLGQFVRTMMIALLIAQQQGMIGEENSASEDEELEKPIFSVKKVSPTTH